MPPPRSKAQRPNHVRVACRIRPILPLVDREPQIVVVPADGKVKVLDPDKAYPTRRQDIDYLRVDYVREKIFQFDHVYGPQIETLGLFEDAVKPLISSVTKHNVTIFAYGQTGSGKVCPSFHISLFVTLIFFFFFADPLDAWPSGRRGDHAADVAASL